MRKVQLERYRRRLEQEQDDMRALIARSGQAIRTTREDEPEDSAAQAANSYSKEFLSHQSDTNLSQLNLIEGALRRIDSDEFGRCLSCNARIEAKRLNAVPWTQHCRACQELAEELKTAEPRRAFSLKN